MTRTSFSLLGAFAPTAAEISTEYDGVGLPTPIDRHWPSRQRISAMMFMISSRLSDRFSERLLEIVRRQAPELV
jgi:hypothetical protein